MLIFADTFCLLLISEDGRIRLQLLVQTLFEVLLQAAVVANRPQHAFEMLCLFLLISTFLIVQLQSCETLSDGFRWV